MVIKNLPCALTLIGIMVGIAAQPMAAIVSLKNDLPSHDAHARISKIPVLRISKISRADGEHESSSMRIGPDETKKISEHNIVSFTVEHEVVSECIDIYVVRCPPEDGMELTLNYSQIQAVSGLPEGFSVRKGRWTGKTGIEWDKSCSPRRKLLPAEF